MKLTGTCFAFDVPATWTVETKEGLVTATSDESFAGFNPDIVPREWQVKRPTRSSLARASWANLREISREKTVLHVEAIPDRSALGFCPTERIPRVLLELIGFHPAWEMRFRYTMTRHEPLAKLLADIPPGAAILGNRADANEITVTSNPRRPFWELLLEAPMRLTREGSDS